MLGRLGLHMGVLRVRTRRTRTSYWTSSVCALCEIAHTDLTSEVKLTKIHTYIITWRPGGPLKLVSALKSYSCPSQAIRETWRVLKVGVSPGELPRPLSGHQGEPDGLEVGSALWSFPDPYQAIMETCWALDVCVSPEELLVPLSGCQRPGRPWEWVSAPRSFQRDLEGPRRGC